MGGFYFCMFLTINYFESKNCIISIVVGVIILGFSGMARVYSVGGKNTSYLVRFCISQHLLHNKQPHNLQLAFFLIFRYVSCLVQLCLWLRSGSGV